MKTCTTLLMALGVMFNAGNAALAQGQSSDTASDNAMRSEAGLEQESASNTSDLPQPVTQDDVTYLCGGVGDEETAFMKQEARSYDLMLTFAARNGAYLADVDVDIKDARGNDVLQTACDAPILLVDLPRSGTYRVRAEAAGYELNKTVRVNAGKRARPRVAAAVMSWPQQVVEAGWAAPTSTGASGASGDTDSGKR